MSQVQKEAKDVKEVFHKLISPLIQQEIAKVKIWVKSEQETLRVVNIHSKMEHWSKMHDLFGFKILSM